MDRLIIHVDMDAFYASIEARDKPALDGKPLIIGPLPQEQGAERYLLNIGIHANDRAALRHKFGPPP